MCVWGGGALSFRSCCMCWEEMVSVCRGVLSPALWAFGALLLHVVDEGQRACGGVASFSGLDQRPDPTKVL